MELKDHHAEMKNRYHPISGGDACTIALFWFREYNRYARVYFDGFRRCVELIRIVTVSPMMYEYKGLPIGSADLLNGFPKIHKQLDERGWLPDAS